MTLSPAFLDELRVRTTLSTLIGRSVKLTKAGREYKACCPFHSEKTPSFYVNDEKGFYHCFGCQAHGDAIRWLTDARGLPFMDAVKELADAAGMQVPAPDPRAQEKADKAAGLYEVVEAAQHWFEEQLGGLEGGEARAYLQKRGISEATRSRFGLGYAPDSGSKLRVALRDFGNEKLVEAGLLGTPEGEREPYARFRGRLTFPIRDRRGRVIAFSARALGAAEPKYLNSPDTPLFDKGRTLFNIDKAAAASREARRVIVVEGQMDAIALDQAGLGEAVAPLGTALTEAQLGLLWRLSPTPILCFDGDPAGRKAAVRALFRALPHVGPDRSLGFVTLPPGQDPDDLIRSSGLEALEVLLREPEPLVEHLWRYETTIEPLATPEQRAGLRRRLIDHVSTIGDPDVRDQYRSELLGRYFEMMRPAQRQWTPGAPRRPFVPQRPVSAEAKGVASGGLDPRTLHAVLQGLIRYPQVIADHAEAIAALRIADAPAARLRGALLDAALANVELDRERLLTILATSGSAPLAEKLGRTRTLAFSFTRRDCDPERASRDLVLVIDTLAAQPGLDAALEAATERLKEDGDEAAFAEQQRLRSARNEADRKLAALVESEANARMEQGV
ncbi:DNA primase [Allosphingosinicella sp.]|uniref:DNA primase n=1 Tax=Allosphingosinicella sp. TaxID=2823234 RepID=UPI002F01D748